MQCIELQLVAQHVQSVAEKADPILKKKAGVSLLTELFSGPQKVQCLVYLCTDSYARLSLSNVIIQF